MKIRWVGLTILAGALLWVAVNQARIVTPTPENESAFLKAYTPKQVIDRFKAAEYSELLWETSNGAGYGFATHGKDFEPTIVVNSKDKVALMQAVRDDIVSELVEHLADVLQVSGSAAEGFTFKYRLGKSEGNVFIGGLQDAARLPQAQDPRSNPDNVTVTFRIHIDEKWIRHKPDRREPNVV